MSLTTDNEDSHLSSALFDYQNAYLEEQRAILWQIEEEKSKNALQQLHGQQSGCEASFASTRLLALSTLEGSEIEQLDTGSPSHSYKEHEKQASPCSTFDDVQNDDDLIPEQLRILEEIQGTSQRAYSYPETTVNEIITGDDVLQEQMSIMQEIEVQDASTTKPAAKVTSPPRSVAARRLLSHAIVEEQVEHYRITE